MNLTSSDFNFWFTGCKSWFIQTLLCKFLNYRPLCLNFIRGLSNTSTLPLVIYRRVSFASVVCSCNLSLPLCFLFCLLRASKVIFEIVFVFLLLYLKLLSLSLWLLRHVPAFLILRFAFILNTGKSKIFSVFNKLRVSNRLNLLFLCASLICSIYRVLLGDCSGVLSDSDYLTNTKLL